MVQVKNKIASQLNEIYEHFTSIQINNFNKLKVDIYLLPEKNDSLSLSMKHIVL